MFQQKHKKLQFHIWVGYSIIFQLFTMVLNRLKNKITNLVVFFQF